MTADNFLLSDTHPDKDPVCQLKSILLQMKERCPPVPQDITALAWKAQLRLHKTYRRLTARGKRSVVATAAVARELLGFIWSIGQLVPLGA